jgi:hypothetical protein
MSFENMSNITEQENNLWADFERRTEHMTGRELAAEMDKHCQAINELERDKPGDSQELRQERALLRQMRAIALTRKHEQPAA